MVTVTVNRSAMRDENDDRTIEMLEQKRGRGRPKTGKAMTPAEKQAAYRERKKSNTVTVTVNRDDLAVLKQMVVNPDPALQLDPQAVERLSTSIFEAILAQKV